MKKLRWIIAFTVVAGALYWLGWIDRPSGPRSLRVFDPFRMAELEMQMWQAYYKKDKLRLFHRLTTLLREQNRYPRAKAIRAGFHFARAAATFGDTRDNYERVLPDLEKGYAIARDFTGAGFDPAKVARAELAWWVARRDAAQSSVENVGRLIGEEYALYYEIPYDKVAEAGLLRAEAAKLRDDGGDEVDWEKVHKLLRRSFKSLYIAVAPPGSRMP